MLSEDQKKEIRQLFDERDENFAARQELLIHKTVSDQISKSEEARRSRLQFLVALGGAGLISLGFLAWSSIESLVSEQASDEISSKVDELEALKSEFDEQARSVGAL